MATEKPKNDAIRIARRVRRRRLYLGWTQDELALQADISRSLVGMVEQGRRVPSLGVLERLADALRVKPGSLLR